MSFWHTRLGVAGASTPAAEGLDLVGLRALVPLVAGAPIRAVGRAVGHVREPWLIGRELFALAEITDAAFEAQLRAWERRGHLQTAVGLCILGRRVPLDQGEGEPSSIYVAVAAVEVVNLPRSAACFLWSAEAAAGGVLPALTAAMPRAWTPRPARGADPLGAMRRRFTRHGAEGAAS